MRVACYYRVSTADQSIESQRREVWNAAMRFLREGGAKPEPSNIDEFSDVASVSRRAGRGRDAAPGKLRRDARPGFDALMAACERGDVQRIVCAEVSRLARDVAEGAELIRKFIRIGAPIYFVRGGYDTADKHGVTGAMGELVSAEVEAMWISERTKAGLRATTRKVGRRSVVSAVDARTLVDLRDKGVPWRQIAQRLQISQTTVRRHYAAHAATKGKSDANAARASKRRNRRLL